MFWVIPFLIAGILLGLFFKKKLKDNKLIEKLINISIYLLLFTLGLKAGSNDAIVRNLHNLGFTAFLISIFSMIGSIVMAWIIYSIFFKNEEK